MSEYLANAPKAEDFPILLTPADTKDKIYIVTGANQNLGLEASRYLVQLGALPRGVAEAWHLDLASYESVKKFAEKANIELNRIDGVIQNAGTAHDTWVSAEGHEMNTTVNVYSTLLLAILLLPKMKETGKRFSTLPHLVNVESSYSFAYEKDTKQLREGGIQSLDVEAEAVLANRYAVTKMVGIFTTFQLAELLGSPSSTNVIVNVVCPGLVKTNLLSNQKETDLTFMHQLHAAYGREPAPASRAYLHAVNAGQESHGKFLRDCQIQQETVPEWFTDAEGKKLQKLLWDGVVQELERVVPGAVKKPL